MDNPQQVNNKTGFDALKLMEWAVSVIFIFIIIGLLAGFFPLSHSFFTQYAQAFIEKSSKPDSCTVGKVTLTPWKGITLYDVSVYGYTNQNSAYELHLSKVRISCNIIQIVLKWSQIKTSYLEFRKHFWETAQNDICAALDALLRFAAQEENIKSILIDGQNINILKENESLVAAEKFSFDITRSKENIQNLELAFEAAEFHYLKNVITFLRTSAIYDNRTININKCRGRIFDGKFRMNTDLNLQSRLVLCFTLSASDLSIDQLMAPLGTMYGCFHGKTNIDINLEPSALSIDSIKGKGIFHASDLIIEESPVQQALVDLFSIPNLYELPFTKMKMELKIAGRDSFFTDITGTGEVLDFKSKGQVNLNGILNQRIDAAFSDNITNEFPEFIANSLEVNEDDRKTIRCRVYGSFASPKVELDKEILKKTIGNVFEQMKENFKDFFRKK